MVLSRISIAVALLCACSVPPVHAQAQGQGKSDSTMQKLEAFRSTGGPMTLETVPQTGASADALRRNLQKIKLPAGFKIDLYAIVPDARVARTSTDVSTPRQPMGENARMRAWVDKAAPEPA